MPGSNAVKERIEELVSQARENTTSDGYQQRAWLVAAQHAVLAVCPSSNNPYHRDAYLDPPVLTALKAKRARAAAGLRTSAAHARWDEIDLGDVAPVIELTKELIGTHLA